MAVFMQVSDSDAIKGNKDNIILRSSEGLIILWSMYI